MKWIFVCYFLVKIPSRVLFSEIDEIHYTNVVLDKSKVSQLILNVFRQDERTSKNWRVIRARKGNWVIAVVIFAGFTKWLGKLNETTKKIFYSKITQKMFETNFSFHMKWCNTGKVKFLFFKSFLVLTRLSFWQGTWALGCHSLGSKHFPDIS